MSNKFETETRERHDNAITYREHEQKTMNYTKKELSPKAPIHAARELKNSL